MNEFLEYDESKKTIKTLNLDDFSIEDLNKYSIELEEEIELIKPAIQVANEKFDIQAVGPLSPDTIFVRAKNGEFDAVVTMYHDQGQIAMKLMGFEQGITLQAGLPWIVTTPAHGTAFDIAGKGIAKVSAFREAFTLARKMIS